MTVCVFIVTFDEELSRIQFWIGLYVAKDFNKLLHQFGIQYRQGKHWVLYQKYADKGYTQYEAFAYNDNKGVHNNLKWTQKGRKFIYDILKEQGIVPKLEQMELLPN